MLKWTANDGGNNPRLLHPPFSPPVTYDHVFSFSKTTAITWSIYDDIKPKAMISNDSDHRRQWLTITMMTNNNNHDDQQQQKQPRWTTTTMMTNNTTTLVDLSTFIVILSSHLKQQIGFLSLIATKIIPDLRHAMVSFFLFSRPSLPCSSSSDDVVSARLSPCLHLSLGVMPRFIPLIVRESRRERDG